MCNIEIISIEGNIGSGKSTLLANLKKHFQERTNIIFLPEPVQEWNNVKDENGTTMIEKFYADQNNYAFPFQMLAYISRIKLLKQAIQEIKQKHKKNKQFICQTYYIITERSIYTDKMVFAKMLFDDKKIEYINYQIYLNWFDTFSNDYPIHKVIYVKTHPQICFQRINERNRKGEEVIQLSYLNMCDKYHNSMLDKTNTECCCQNQLLLDGNYNIHKDKEQWNKHIMKINDFITNTL